MATMTQRLAAKTILGIAAVCAFLVFSIANVSRVRAQSSTHQGWA
jgi:hypothetical protein